MGVQHSQKNMFPKIESTPISMAAGWSRSRSTPHSKTFRDSLKRSVLKVKEFSQELVRLPTRKAGPSSPTVRIEDIDSGSAAATHDPLVDSELGLVDDDGAFDPRRRRLGPSSLAPAAGNKKKALVARIDSTGAGFALEGLRFIAQATAATEEGQNKLWEAVEARFHSLAVSPDNQLQQLPRSKFPECIGMKDSKEFATELYDVLVRRKGGSAAAGSLSVQESISKDELHEFWLEITDNSFDTRMEIFFDICDKNADGHITGEEVKEVIVLSASANKLTKLKEQAEEYAALIMEELDVDQMGYIELSQLKALMRGSVAALNKEAIIQYTQILIPQKTKNRIQRFMDRSRLFLMENWKCLWVIVLWLGAMAGLFSWKFLQYRDKNAFIVMGYCVCVAKASIETVKLNMALILLPVCRNTLTWLRSTKLGSFIPFDENLEFHKIIAAAIGVGVLLHSITHIACDLPRIANASHEKFERSLGEDFNYHQPTYWDLVKTIDGITGIAMVLLMSIAFLFASRWFRRSLVKLPRPFHRMTGFNAFWYTHHIFIIVYVLLIVHGQMLILRNKWYNKTTWMYIAIPAILYNGEKAFCALRSNRHRVDVVKASIHTGNVLAILMTKPANFKYKSGMYLFVKCPQISSFEWHPFSITSAPGDPFLSIHIRASGDWTNAMRQIFREACGDRMHMQAQNDFGLSGEITSAPRFPRLVIDGPYGAPAQDYLKYDVLLLVGLGIGATPFISILKDMLNRSKENSPISSPVKGQRHHHQKPQCTMTKAYFYWVTREQGSFDWFRGVMKDVEESDQKAVIEMHNYLTSVYEEGDARSALVTMLQALNQAKDGMDFVSGTRARTHFGRPDWKTVFSSLAATHKDKHIGVFYCGPVALVKELQTLCSTYTSKSTTKFEFHKENF
ncbi:unnamed protein product [Sphagnum jensenii]|uniref:Uncharacterized protein n=1 Tax=Sphagnum jensenii TaxID=128206 RepID=A0ABP1BK90_9BRYO